MATLIFFTHLATLLALVFLGVAYMAGTGGGHLWMNLEKPLPDEEITTLYFPGNVLSALFFGTCTGMLGVSGFESSSQFVEQQKPGVFMRTLRNMWLGVAFFNPVMSLISLAVLPMRRIRDAKGNLLAVVAAVVGDWVQDAAADAAGTPRSSATALTLGDVLQLLVCVDAFVVLCGAVLTAYVGINGLACRMAADRVLPTFLLERNRWRGTTHYTTLVFLVLSASQVAILDGNVDGLSGVYTFAFLGVMLAFGVGTIMLKFKRPSLPREFTVSYARATLGVICVFAVFLGNLVGKSEFVSYFSFYLVGVGSVMVIMFQRARLLKLAYLTLHGAFPRRDFGGLKRAIRRLRAGPMLFFAKHPDLYVLNKAVLYVRDNEQTENLIVVHVAGAPEAATPVDAAQKPWRRRLASQGGGDVEANGGQRGRAPRAQTMADAVETLDLMYPKLRVSLLTVRGTFGPALVEWLATKTGVPKNDMMIACPDAIMPDKLYTFGGLRIITH